MAPLCRSANGGVTSLFCLDLYHVLLDKFGMKFPQDLIEHFGTAQDFAEAARRHPKAPPRRLNRAAVYAWKTRGMVPYMWRPVVEAMRAEMGSQEAAE